MCAGSLMKNDDSIGRAGFHGGQMQSYALAAVEKYKAELAQQSATVSSDIDPVDANFEEWYACNAHDYVANPIGSRDCGLQRKAWNAALQYAATKGKEKEQEDDYVIKRLSGILAEISIALKGEELPLHSHGYHDLVELTQTNVLAIELYKHENTQRSERDKEVDEALLEYDATVFKDPARRNGNLPGETLKKIRKIWRGEK